MSEPQHTLESLETNWNNAIKLCIKRTKERDEALERIAALTAERDQLRKDCDCLGKERRMWLSKELALEAERDQLRKERDAFEQVLIEENKKAEDQAESRRNLIVRVANSEKERETLSAKVTHLTNALEAEQKESEALAAKYESARKDRYDLLSATATDLHCSAAEWQMRTAKAESEARTLAARVAELTKERDALKDFYVASKLKAAIASQSAQQAPDHHPSCCATEPNAGAAIGCDCGFDERRRKAADVAGEGDK